MTTIIAINTAEERAIYCDSLVQHGSTSATGYKKFFVLPDVLIGAWCGTYNGGLGVIAALEDIVETGDICAFFRRPGRHETRRMSEGDQREFEMLLLYDRQIWLMCEDLTPIRVLLPFMAKGSGGLFALGALAAGASPWEALAIASRYDVSTGGVSFRCDTEGKITCFPHPSLHCPWSE